MTTTIPVELIFYIISFLQDNKAALSTCSLCCSALAAASRPLLFHTLRTGLNPEAVDRFERLLVSGPDVLALIKRIDVAISTLEPITNQRTIAVISQIMASRHIQDTPPALRIAIRPIGQSLYRFGQLLLPRLDPVVHWVTSLELGQFDFAGDIQLWDLVLALPKLKSLIFGRINVGTTVHIPTHRESEVSHIILKRPALDGSSNIHWLLIDHPMPLPSLTSLDVRFPMVLDRAPIRLGEVYGATVRALRFGIAIIPHQTKSWNKLVCDASAAEFISKFRNLETLTFQGILAPRVPDRLPPLAFEWIHAALGGVSPTVRKLTMEVVAGHLSYLDIIPWSAIDARLAHQLQSVTTVEILLAAPVGVTYLLEGVSQEMEMRLPLAAQRGVLRCFAVAEHPI